MSTTSRPDAAVRDVFHALFRHKGKATLLFCCVVGGVLVWNALSPNTYRSESKLLLRLGRENTSLDPTVTLGQQQVAVPLSRESEVNSVVEVLNSRAVAEKVVDAIGPEIILNDGDAQSQAAIDAGTSPSAMARIKSGLQACLGSGTTPQSTPRDEAVARVTRGLDVSPAMRSNIVRVSYESRSPQVSHAVLDKLVEIFLQEHMRVSRPQGSHEFLANQAAQLRADVDHGEQQLCLVKKETGLTWVEGRRKTVVERVGVLEDELIRANAELSASETAVKHLRETLATLPKTQVSSKTVGVGNDGTDRMRERYYGLQVNLEEARAKFTASHPVMQQISEQAAAARQILDGEEKTREHVTTTPTKAYEQTTLDLLTKETALASLRAKSDSLETQLTKARAELKVFNDHEARIAKLQRDKEIQEVSYRKYATALEEARIDKALESQKMSNISIVQPATQDVQPVRPRRMVNLLAGIVAGLFGAMSLAVVAECLNRSFMTPEDIEKQLQLPTLAAVPRMARSELALNGRK